MEGRDKRPEHLRAVRPSARVDAGGRPNIAMSDASTRSGPPDLIAEGDSDSGGHVARPPGEFERLVNRQPGNGGR